MSVCNERCVLSGRDISETGRPECGVSECDRDALRRPWPTMGCCAKVKERVIIPIRGK